MPPHYSFGRGAWLTGLLTLQSAHNSNIIHSAAIDLRYRSFLSLISSSSRYNIVVLQVVNYIEIVYFRHYWSWRIELSQWATWDWSKSQFTKILNSSYSSYTTETRRFGFWNKFDISRKRRKRRSQKKFLVVICKPEGSLKFCWKGLFWFSPNLVHELSISRAITPF